MTDKNDAAITAEPGYYTHVRDASGQVWRRLHLTTRDNAEWWMVQFYDYAWRSYTWDEVLDRGPVTVVTNQNLWNPWPVDQLVVATRKSDGVRALWARTSDDAYIRCGTTETVTHESDTLDDVTPVHVLPDDAYNTLWNGTAEGETLTDLAERVDTIEGSLTW